MITEKFVLHKCIYKPQKLRLRDLQYRFAVIYETRSTYTLHDMDIMVNPRPCFTGGEVICYRPPSPTSSCCKIN